MSRINTIPWEDSVWFFDIDDTLIDTEGSHLVASEGVARVLGQHYEKEKVKEVQARFNEIFATLLAGYRVKDESEWQQLAPGSKKEFEGLLATIENCQERVRATYAHSKIWSREVFIKIALEQHGLPWSPELIHEAADAYWVRLSQQVPIFQDALTLLREVKQRNRPIYLATGSDARLRSDNDGQFDYQPAYSEALKRERIEIVRQRGLMYNALSIGDPEDKPRRSFFEKAVKMAERDCGHSLNLACCIMAGDSYGGDLKVPKEELGFGLVGLINRKGADRIIDGRQVEVTRLTALAECVR